MASLSSPAKAVEKTANRKVGNVSVTMAAQVSCPNTCPFFHSGCYAETGPQGIHTARLNKCGARIDHLKVARAEANAIDGLSGKRPLRLHVVGDCKDNRSAKTVAAACDRYQSRGNQPTWTYTHAWRDVARSAWGAVSVLASCETTADARKAMRRGYGVSIVVSEYKGKRPYQADGLRVIPCPQTTGKALSCDACKLCWNDRWLRETRTVIAFEAHGSGARKARVAISQSQQ